MLLILLLQTLSPPDIWHDANTLALIAIVAAVVIGVAGVAATIFAAIYPVRKQQRNIEYSRVSDAPIVTLNETMASRMQVLLDGKPVEHARLRVIEVRNTGNTVRTEDYFEPLTFEFDEEVIGGDVLKPEPKNRNDPSHHGPFLTLGSKSVQLPLFPLRRGDSIRFTVLLKGESEMRVKGKIDGTITEFDPLEQTVPVTNSLRLRHRAATIYGLLMFVIGGVLLIFFSQNVLPGDQQVDTAALILIGFFLCIVGFFMLEYVFLNSLKRRIKTLRRKKAGS